MIQRGINDAVGKLIQGDTPHTKFCRGEAFAEKSRFVATKSERKCFVPRVRSNTLHEFANSILSFTGIALKRT
jgi:hypothetical protein